MCIKSKQALEWTRPLTLEALKYFVQTMETKGFFQFEIIITVLASFFALFKYLYDVPTVIGNMFTLTVRGSILDVRV